MPRYVDFLGRDGKMYRAEQRGENSALPYIQKRLENLMPVEVVKIEDAKQTIRDLRVNYQRDITLEEAQYILKLIKRRLIEQLDQLEKYYISKEEIENKNEDKE